MSHKKVFSQEERINIVDEHLKNHKTLKQLVEEYDISKSYLCYILKKYREEGTKGLDTTKYYSTEFKLKLLNEHYYDEAMRCPKRVRYRP